ncbi:STAS domain-containing protein [Streptomyces mirabilis]|jgi:anti-anti-sigma factor|uniref:Anti-anti-sigma factor n=1 Tax=Streptomyces mirabilis TaxID=68239 RepID=A0A1I2RED0_9ACTN|nr:STAS domain-containing protein [Streptomyces mirabilis]SFG36957.1 anti-anti-sigma factor [Streptomyces mirabilis]
MPLPPLTIYRHDRRKRALITLAGEIDLDTVPLVRASLARCLRDGIRTIDVDLTLVTFCDCNGLNAFLHASQRITAAGGTLRLHHPPRTLALMLDIAGGAFLFLGVPFGQLSPPPGYAPVTTAPVPPHRSVPPVPPVPVLSGGAV